MTGALSFEVLRWAAIVGGIWSIAAVAVAIDARRRRRKWERRRSRRGGDIVERIGDYGYVPFAGDERRRAER